MAEPGRVPDLLPVCSRRDHWDRRRRARRRRCVVHPSSRGRRLGAVPVVGRLHQLGPMARLAPVGNLRVRDGRRPGPVLAEYHRRELAGAGRLRLVAADRGPRPVGISYYVRGLDGSVYARQWNGSSWSIYFNLGGFITSVPTAVVDTAGTSVFARGGDGALYSRRFENGTWKPWLYYGGNLLSDAIVTSVDSVDHVFVVGTDGGLYTRQITFAPTAQAATADTADGPKDHASARQCALPGQRREDVARPRRLSRATSSPNVSVQDDKPATRASRQIGDGSRRSVHVRVSQLDLQTVPMIGSAMLNRRFDTRRPGR